MGREIRRVPLDWEHPQNEVCPHLNGMNWSHKQYISPTDYQYGKCFIPLFDQDYKAANKEWQEGLTTWQDGTHEDFQEGEDYWEWAGNPPDKDSFRPKWETNPIGYQVYETVSEGTPVSPIFETIVELKDWLMAQGYSEKASEQFIKDEWAISLVYTPATGLKDGISALDDI